MSVTFLTDKDKIDLEESIDILNNEIETLKESGGGSSVPCQPGADGATYTPAVSSDGVLSWTNDKGLSNPDPVDIKGPQGEPGTPGADGYTPVKGVDYFDGQDGSPGKDGADGVSVAHEWDGTVLKVTSASGTSSADLKGDKGEPGEPGATPAKGKDYFTEADKADMVDAVKNSIPGLGDLLGSGAEEATYIPDLPGYLVVETGAIDTSAAGAYHTDYLALDGYVKISAECNISSYGYALAFFDESKNILPAISIGSEGSSITTTIEMDVPSEAAYCMLSDYEYSGASTAYITLIHSKGILDRVDELEVTTNPLNGKTVAVLGDSISSVDYTTPNYWQLIAEKTGCKFLDYGVSGSCFTVRSGFTTSFVERAANMETADAVLVMGGTNDAGKDILLGEWASTDTTTLYGALNSLISLLRTKYPGRPIVFCTPIKSMYVEDNGFPVTMDELKAASASTNLELWHCALAIKAKCAVHGIPVIDLYNESGIGSQLSIYFRTDDKLHPSDIGECRIANMVQPVLEQQFLYTTEYPEIPVEPDGPSTGYTNLVPTSIDANGSVYNSTGYMDGYRLSSSGGVSSSAVSTATHTGFIEFTKGDTIRVIVPGTLSGAGNYFNSYDGSFAFLNDESLTGFTNGTYGTTETLSDGRVLITIFTGTLGSIDSAEYFRISANPATGASLIVTVNQEIT